MRITHESEHERKLSDSFGQSYALIAPNQAAKTRLPGSLYASDCAHGSVTQLLHQCCRDTPMLENLNVVNWLASGCLILLLPILLVNGSGPLSAITASSLIGMNYAMRRALRRGYARDAEAFAELGPDAVPELIEHLCDSNIRIEAITSLVLAQLLPTLTREQFLAINDDHRKGLYSWLKAGSTGCTDAKISILRWLADVAGSDAVVYIEQISTSYAFTPHQRRLRREAIEVIPQILQREHESENARSSTVIGASGETEELAVTEESRALMAEIRKHSATRTTPGMRMGFLTANWCFITPYVAYKFWECLVTRGGVLLDLLWFALAIGSSQLYRLALTPAHTRMARKLAKMDDTHAIGALAEALDWPDEEIQMVARTALIRLLPKLSITDAPLLNSRQRTCLNNRLVLANSRNYLNSQLQKKILAAWENVGDLSSLKAVKSLAAAKATHVYELEVQSAAVRCLPFLEARAHLNQSSQVLLRASGIPEAGADTLVRPAAITEVQENELLRPAE